MEQCISLAPKKPITNCMELELLDKYIQVLTTSRNSLNNICMVNVPVHHSLKINN